MSRHPKPTDACFALLDDHRASPGQPSARLCTGFAHVRSCDDPATLQATWSRVEADLAAGLQAVLVIDYEWGAKLHGVLPAGAPGRLRARQPVAFGALIRLPAPDAAAASPAEPEWLLSCSPELFVQHCAGQFEARPVATDPGP